MEYFQVRCPVFASDNVVSPPHRCIEHFKEFPAHLVEWVEFGQQSATPPNKPHGPVLPPQLEALVKGKPPPATSAAALPVSLPSAKAVTVGPKPAAAPQIQRSV